MKSIVYLSYLGDRPCLPRLVEHDPRFPAWETYKRSPRWLSPREAHLKYVCTIPSTMGVHEKINRRAEDIGRTATFYGLLHRPQWGGPPWGRDYRFHMTPERIARSRLRNAKRLRRINPKGWHYGKSTLDIAYGVMPLADRQNFTRQELEHIRARLHLAATERGPLPPWRLCDCWPENREEQAA